jgi:hypothetical protein
MKASLLTICLAVTISNAFSQVKSNSNLKAILTGNWITTAYLKELKATLSPHKAQINTKLALQLFIDIKPADKTSTVTDMWTLHEGGYGFSIYFKPGVKKGTFKTNFVDYDHPGTAFSDIGYEVIEKDTRLVIYHYGKNNKLLDKTYFTKAGAAGILYDQVLDYEVNKTIFTGSYKFTDSTGNSKTIQFTNNGTVTGFNGFEKYSATTFFLAPKNFYDEINFIINGKTVISYAFKKEGTTLFLYDFVKEDKFNYKQGALKYTLVKE